MNSIPRLSHSILLLLVVLATAACGRPDAPLADDAPPTAVAAVTDSYPPPLVASSYPALEQGDLDAYPAPTVRLAPTPLPIIAMPPAPAAAVTDSYPPPLVASSYPAPEQGDLDAYPAPTVRLAPTPLPMIAMPPAPAADFAFVFEWSWCNPDIVNTFDHTYTQKNLTETWAMTPLTLTETEMTAIYQKMVEVNFFAYPEQYWPQAADGRGVSAPALHYRFTVRNNAGTNVVDWIDASPNPPSNEEARRLKELGEFIIAITQAHPEVKQLPERQVACW